MIKRESFFENCKNKIRRRTKEAEEEDREDQSCCAPTKVASEPLCHSAPGLSMRRLCPLLSSPPSSLLFCLPQCLLFFPLSLSPISHTLSTSHRQRPFAQVAAPPVCHGPVISLAPLPCHVDAAAVATWPPLTASSIPVPWL